jgi:hypothetical protein
MREHLFNVIDYLKLKVTIDVIAASPNARYH